VLDRDFDGLVPSRDPQLRMIAIDVSELRAGKTEPEHPAAGTPRPRHVVAFAQANGGRREPLFVSDQTARILELSDGTRTVIEIVREIGSENPPKGEGGALRQIEELFVSGLLWLREAESDHVEAAQEMPLRSE
jgi:hypothetical protein